MFVLPFYLILRPLILVSVSISDSDTQYMKVLNYSNIIRILKYQNALAKAFSKESYNGSPATGLGTRPHNKSTGAYSTP